MNSGAPEPGGFDYWVSDEELAKFHLLSWEARLSWLDELRQFILEARPAEIAERQERLRRGETIV